MHTAQIVAISSAASYVLLCFFCVAWFSKSLDLTLSMIMAIHLFVLIFVPAMGMEWALVAWFFLGCFDCGLWLFRQEVSTAASKAGRQGLAARFGIMAAASCVLLMPTPVLQVFSGWVK